MLSIHRNRLAAITGAVTLALLAAACGDGQESPTPRGVVAASPAQPKPVTAIPVSDVEVVEPAAPTVPADVTYADAESVFHSGRYDDAAEMFGVYVDSHPDNAWGHYMLGLSAWRAGDIDRAASALERCVELDSANVKARTNLARVLLDQDRARDALVHIEVARSLDPESSQVLRVTGNALSELDRADEALATYRDALLLDPQDAWSMNNYALMLIRLGRFEEALPPLARAVELKPESALFQNNLGIALERTGDLVGASTAYAAALSADSTHERARISMDRVAQQVYDGDAVVMDLQGLAMAFVEEMERWATPPQPVVIGTPVTPGAPQD